MFQEKNTGQGCPVVSAILCAIIFCSSVLSAGTIYVDGAATGANNGSSWTDAYTDLQTALGASISEDEIWVAAGTYKPTTGTDRAISFIMKEGVSLYGGFAGSETTRDQRNWLTNETILSGDIGAAGDFTDNSYHVLEGADNAVLDGFVVTAGYANGGGEWDVYGGGMYNNQDSPTVRNCIFSDNHAAEFGGGVFAYQGDPAISYCTFIGNTAKSGSVAFYACNSPSVKHCVFSGNSVLSFGGGIYSYQSGTVVMNCSLCGNSADFGGGFYSDQGPVVSNSILWGNFAPHSSQIYSSADVTYCAVEGGWGDPVDYNIDRDPNFADEDGIDNILGTVDDDLHIGPYSFCINRGDPNGNYAGLSDMDGQSRVRYQRVDIGAYEVFPIGGDLNADEEVGPDDLVSFAADQWLIDADLADFAMFGVQWLYGTGPIAGDLNGDKRVDMDDLLILVASDMWLIETDLYVFSQIAGNWLYGVE